MSNNYMIEYLVENTVIAVFVKASSPDKALDAAFDSLAKKFDPKVNIPSAFTLKNTDEFEIVQSMVRYGIPGKV